MSTSTTPEPSTEVRDWAETERLKQEIERIERARLRNMANAAPRGLSGGIREPVREPSRLFALVVVILAFAVIAAVLSWIWFNVGVQSDYFTIEQILADR